MPFWPEIGINESLMEPPLSESLACSQSALDACESRGKYLAASQALDAVLTQPVGDSAVNCLRSGTHCVTLTKHLDSVPYPPTVTGAPSAEALLHSRSTKSFSGVASTAAGRPGGPAAWTAGLVAVEGPRGRLG